MKGEKPGLDTILEITAKHFGLQPKQMKGSASGGNRDVARNAFFYCAHYLGHASTAVAPTLGVSVQVVNLKHGFAKRQIRAAKRPNAKTEHVEFYSACEAIMSKARGENPKATSTTVDSPTDEIEALKEALRRAEAALQEEKRTNDGLRKRLNQAKAKLKPAEEAAGAAGIRAAEAEKRAQAAEKKLAAAAKGKADPKELTALKEKLASAKAEAEAAKKRAEQAEAELSKAKADKARAVEEAKAEALERAVAAETKVAEAEELAATALKRTTAAKEAKTKAEKTAAAALERATAAEEAQAQAEEAVTTAEQEAKAATTRAEKAEASAAEAANRIAELEEQAAAALKRATAAEEAKAEAEQAAKPKSPTRKKPSPMNNEETSVLLHQLVKATCKAAELEPAEFKSGKKPDNRARRATVQSAFCYLAKVHTKAKMAAIAMAAGVEERQAETYAKVAEGKIVFNKELKELARQIRIEFHALRHAA